MLFDIIVIVKPFEVVQWFLLTIGSMVITTYLNILFFSNITVNVTQGLQILALFTICETITAYCRLRQGFANKNLVCDIIKHVQTKLNLRILSTDWIRIKVSDQVEIRRKVEDAATSVHCLVEYFFLQLPGFLKFMMTIGTIFYIYPVATIFIAITYICSYRFYLNKKSNDLLTMKLKFSDIYAKLSSKYARASENMFEYVIHHDKDKIINITNELKVEMERKWQNISHLYDLLSFEENIIGRLCTFSTLLAYAVTHEASVFIIPLYHHLLTLTTSIDEMLIFYIQSLRYIKDYHIIIPILEQYEERVNTEQKHLRNEIEIEDLSFKYTDARATFYLTINGSLTFRKGQAILVTGKSGAGKSTFYDILAGIISMNDYQANVRIDQQQATFHSVEKCRTIVLQDSRMDYRSTIFSMITDIDESETKEKLNDELESLIWHFLRLIHMDDFVRNELSGDLIIPLENKLSGGQKTRLLLARALFQAHQRQSPILILDEPDKGLPAETTVSIIENIIDWYRSKGILFLTLHTEKAHMLDFHQVLHIDNGLITKVK
ncbi:unnamed protein product [Rotaria magnacalcarata]|uniref:ABC transporter domain-containing protein n=6 Tax=Rotaria magnacalcarata TaxID=392030 RepID=A0A816YVK4_9BILA|nr:unnamed protein product [Rotaria magnacalcarata]CAF4101601.1 unnamed protein product [Rotaria magnacalcarata]